MTTVIEMREATAEDALGIAMVQVETWQGTYGGMIPDATLARLSVSDRAIDWARSITLTANRARTFVLSRGDQVLGFVSAGPNRGQLPYSGEIYALYVATDWQNRGLGRALLGRGLVALMEDQADSALVWVLSQNPARFFYQAMGGGFAARRKEAFEGTELEETAYGWPDLQAWRRAQG